MSEQKLILTLNYDPSLSESIQAKTVSSSIFKWHAAQHISIGLAKSTKKGEFESHSLIISLLLEHFVSSKTKDGNPLHLPMFPVIE